MNYREFIESLKKLGNSFDVPTLGFESKFSVSIFQNLVVIHTSGNSSHTFTEEEYNKIFNRFITLSDTQRLKAKWYSKPNKNTPEIGWKEESKNPNVRFFGYLPSIFRELLYRRGISVCDDANLFCITQCGNLVDLSKTFVVQIEKQINLSVYDFDKWFDSAVKTVNCLNLSNLFKSRKKTYEAWKRTNKQILKDSILQLLKSLKDSFESFDTRIEEIAKETKLPFGTIQKIVTILIKYIVTSYYSKRERSRVVENFSWVKNSNFVKKLPPPVDSLVLKSLKLLGVNDLNIKIQNSVKIDNMAWSKMDMNTYIKIQRKISYLAEIDGVSPLELEMSKLWKK